MIQIDFYSDDIVSLLTPIYSTKPEKVYFLIDSKKNTTKRTAPIRTTILNWGFVNEVHFLSVNRHDVDDISSKLESLIEKTKGQIYIDLTGGSELLVACGYQLCKTENIHAIYMNWEKDYIFDVNSKKEICPISHISLDDFISAVGAKRLNDSHHLPKEKDFPVLLEMAEIIFSRIEDWHALQFYIANTLSYKNQLPESNRILIPPTVKYKDKHRNYSTKFLVEEFVRKGFLLEEGNHNYRFADSTAKEYLRTFGIWLELYIYIKAQAFFDQSFLGVILDWQKNDLFDTQDNEIDVLVMYRSIPVFISCKMREIKPTDVYEVGYLARRLGGKQTRSMIATTYPVSQENNSKTSIYKRMEKMKVGLIESNQFQKTDLDKVFENALKMTE